MKTKLNTRRHIPLRTLRRLRLQLDDESADDLRMQVWLLRILAKLGGHRFLFEDGTFTCDNDALLLGFDPGDDDLTHKTFMVQLQQELQQAERNWKQAAKPPAATLDANLAAIQRLLGCSDAERSVLEFLVLMEHSPRLGLFVSQYLPNSVDAYRAISVLTGISQQTVKAALRPQGALCSSGFVSIDDPKDCSLPNGIQLLSKEFADQMATQPMNPAGLLADKVQPAPQARLTLRDYPHIRKQLDILLPYLHRALLAGRPGVNIFIHGDPGTGKTELSRALAKALGTQVFDVSCEDADGSPVDGAQRLQALRAAHLLLRRTNTLLTFDEAEDVFNSNPFSDSTAQAHKGWVNRMLENNARPTLWLSNSAKLDPAFMRRFDMVFELPIPPRNQRRRILEQACGGLAPPGHVHRLSTIDTLAPAVVARAAAVVRVALPARQPQEQARALECLIDNTLQAQGHRGLRAGAANELAASYDPAFIRTDTDLSNVPQGLARTGSGRLCLYGPPGTGKTAYGRWLADQLNKPLQVERASDLLSMFVGEAEKNIARAFRKAAQDDAILMIDEVDSFLQDRQQAQRSWEITQVNEMLTQMECFTGIFIASTNLMHGLDQATLRRFDLKVKFDYLQPAQALQLLHRHCELLRLPPPESADEHALQRLRNLTPGDFAAVLRQHRFRPLPCAADWVKALQGECALKSDACRAPLGFVG